MDEQSALYTNKEQRVVSQLTLTKTLVHTEFSLISTPGAVEIETRYCHFTLQSALPFDLLGSLLSCVIHDECFLKYQKCKILCIKVTFLLVFYSRYKTLK